MLALAPPTPDAWLLVWVIWPAPQPASANTPTTADAATTTRGEERRRLTMRETSPGDPNLATWSVAGTILVACQGPDLQRHRMPTASPSARRVNLVPAKGARDTWFSRSERPLSTRTTVPLSSRRSKPGRSRDRHVSTWS